MTQQTADVCTDVYSYYSLNPEFILLLTMSTVLIWSFIFIAFRSL